MRVSGGGGGRRYNAGMADEALHAVVGKVFRRLIPICIIAFLLNYIARSNIGIAESAMEGSIPGFTKDVYTWGLIAFFIPYCLLELPSNLLMERVGARFWIARIMISWGIVSMGFALTRGPWSFYGIRTLLGVMEAGFFPGVLLYLSYWFPHEYRARASAYFFLSQVIAQVITNILGGTILDAASHWPGLQPWQWLFIIEGLPSVIMGLVILFYLTDRPTQARWLSDGERAELIGALGRETAHHQKHQATDFTHALVNPFVWILSALYGLICWAYFPMNSFTPIFMKPILAKAGLIVLAPVGMTATQAIAGGIRVTPDNTVSLYIGLFSAIPFGITAICMMFIAGHSDKRNERRYHMAATCGMMAVGWVIAAFAPKIATGMTGVVISLVGMTITTIGVFGTYATFWALPPQLLSGIAGAAAFAIINSIGNFVGNFVGPWTKASWKLSDQNTMLAAAGCALLAAVITLAVPFPKYAPAAQGFEAEMDGVAGGCGGKMTGRGHAWTGPGLGE